MKQAIESIRSYLTIFMYPILLACVMLLTYLPAMQSPSPEGVKIGISGPQEIVTTMVSSLQSGTGDAFTVEAVMSADEARAKVANRELTAVLVLDPADADRAAGTEYWNAVKLPESLESNSAVIYVASAGGSALATTGIIPLENVAAQLGLPAKVQDLVPLANSDRAGNGQMWFAMAVTLTAYVGGTLLGQAAPHLLNVRSLVRIFPVFGMVVGILGVLGLSFVFDTIGAHTPLLIITAMLNITAVGLGTAIICKLFGRFSTLVAMAVFMGIGMTSSGAAIPAQMVPGFYEFFNPIMPYGAVSRVVTNIIYFDNHNLLREWALLGGWVIAMAALLYVIDRWKPAAAPKLIAAENGAPAAQAVAI